jgi:hypothetical protein
VWTMTIMFWKSYVNVYVKNELVKFTLSVWEHMGMFVNLIMMSKAWLLCFGEIE